MKFTLQQITETLGEDLSVLIKKAKHGDRIVLHRGIVASYDMHHDCLDLYHVDQQTLYMNGVEVYAGPFDDWYATPTGFVVSVDNKILSGGKTVLYEGEMKDWVIHPQGGVVILKRVEYPDEENPLRKKYKDQVFKDGTKLLHESKFSVLSRLMFHPDGFLVQSGRDWYINGVKPFMPHIRTKKYAEAFPWHDGFLIRIGDEFIANGITTVHRDWGSNWISNKHGIVIQRGDEISLVVLKS